jgi:hypothetical protein
MDGLLELNNRVTHIEASMATKDDVSAVKDAVAAVSANIAEMNAKMDISSIRQAVEKSHTDIYKWAATLAISAATLSFAVYAGLKQSVPQQVPAQSAQQPIIINVPAQQMTPVPAPSNRH